MAGTILTNIGLSKLAAATPQNQLNITHIAVGDGNGGFPTLSPNATALTNEVWRSTASNPIKDGSNSTYVYFETNIPPEVGPFDVREIACFDIDGDMIAIGHTSLIQKPNPSDDASFAVAVKIFIALENASDFDLIYQNTEVTSHNSLIGRDDAGAHDASAINTTDGGSVQDFIDNIPTEYDLFIIYGQSNPVGQAGGTPGRQEIPDYAYFWYNRGASKEWRPLEYDMPFIDGVLTTTSTGHAWVEFAREYTKRTGRGCLFIPAAYGGTTITELSPPSIHFDALANAIAEVKADTTYNIRATRTLIHQGESDMTAGTTRSEYLSLYVSLWNYIKAEIAEPSHCYIAKVGNPQTRPEQNRYAIQVAQDYLAYNIDDISMAFDGCGSFTVADGTLRPDGTHYTQKGYNLMGLEMAKAVASREITASSSTAESNTLKGYISTPSDQAHRAVGCTLIHDGTDFVLKTINDGGRYRSSFVQEMSVTATGIIVTTSCNTDDIITMQVGLNRIAQLYGLTASIRDAGASGVLIIELFSDVSAYVDTVTGAVTPPDALDNGLLSNVSAIVDAGVTKISYPAHFHKPTVNSVTSDTMSEFVNINQQSSGTTSTWIKYETVPTNETRALVNFKRKPVDLTALALNGLQINVWCVLGDRSL